MSEPNEKSKDLRPGASKIPKDPLQILQMLSKMPPAKSILLKEHESPEKPPPSPARSFSPIEPRYRPFTFKSPQRRERKQFFDATEQPEAQLNIFKRKRRHMEDMSDTLSVISQRSTKSYSRFERLFEKIPSTQELLETQNLTFSTPERVKIQRNLDRMEGIETQTQHYDQTQESMEPLMTQESLIPSIPRPTQESLFHSVLIDTQDTDEQYIEERPKSETREKEKSVASPIIPTSQSEHKEPTPVIPNDEDFAMDDDADYGGGNDDFGFDDEFVVEEDGQAPVDDMKVDEQSSNTSVIPTKRVTQGDSFIGKKMREPVQRFKKRTLLPHVKTKALFQSYLSFNKKLATKVDFTRATSLFSEQLVDDLKSYKNNQPEEDQDEITAEDIILLMTRQRLITDMSSLAALAQKYLPREYNDLVCQAATAYNQLYPGFNQKYKDDFYYYNYDNAKGDDEE